MEKKCNNKQERNNKDVYDIGENNYRIKENSLPQLNLI